MHDHARTAIDTAYYLRDPTLGTAAIPLQGLTPNNKDNPMVTLNFHDVAVFCSLLAKLCCVAERIKFVSSVERWRVAQTKLSCHAASRGRRA